MKTIMIFFVVSILSLFAVKIGFSSPMPGGLSVNQSSHWLPRLKKSTEEIGRQAEFVRVADDARANALLLFAQGKNEDAIRQYELAVFGYFIGDNKPMMKVTIKEAAEVYETMGEGELAEEMLKALDSDEFKGWENGEPIQEN